MSSVSGQVKSAELCKSIEGVKVLLLNKAKEVKEENYSDSQGKWILSEVRGEETISFSKEGFSTKIYNSKDLPVLVRLLDDRLIGYQNKLWFFPGEKVAVCAHSLLPFSAKLFRHGLNKECVFDLGSQVAVRQSVPDGYFVETGLDWEQSFDYQIPDRAQPGIYSLLLESSSQQSFAIPFIISTPKQKYGGDTKLLVLASTNTWQSYNIWGGRSRYRNFENGQSKDFLNLWFTKIACLISRFLPLKVKNILKQIFPSQIGAQDWNFKKLSIRRPFTNCNLEGGDVLQPFINHLASGEWRLLAWLEREKISYDIVSGKELHDDPNLLQHYDAIILSTHCEYWTRQMYKGLKYFHEEKNLWVLNISGNSIYREIDFFEDGSSRCVSLSFKDSCDDETQVLGVRFSLDDFGTCAPFKVALPEHWAFKNIDFFEKKGIFGQRSLNEDDAMLSVHYNPGRPGIKNGLSGKGASGWETDKLSKTAPKDIKVIAKGLNKNGGADMVVRNQQRSRGGMFSCSSIVFTGSLLIDKISSRIVKNVIYRALELKGEE